MPYRYLEDVATADVAFEAWGKTPSEMLCSACDATMNVMVEDLKKLQRVERRAIKLANDSLEMLLFDLLQELIFLKDAECLLLKLYEIELTEKEGKWNLEAQASGETIDEDKHELNVDVKAVTLHRFRVAHENNQWKATVVLDV